MITICSSGKERAPAGVPAGACFIFSHSPQEDPLSAPVFPDGADPLGAGVAALQLRIQRSRVRRVHGHQQTAGGLLMAVDPADAAALYAELQGCDPRAQRIGTVREYRGGKRIFLR